MKSALMVDHLRVPKKVRRAHVIVKLNKETGEFADIAAVRSNEEKAWAFVHDQPYDEYKYKIISEVVL
jgi:hypothetical protein